MSNKYFEDICRLPQMNLKKKLQEHLKTHYHGVTSGDGWLFAQGTFPVCLVAHMDTVHKEAPKQFVYEKGKLSSPQGIGGDDRCGIYMILNIIKRHNCSVLFLEDEENGCVGAEKFINHPISDELKFNYMIELDRRGKDDAIFYECDNPEFEEFITKDGDWVTDFGSFSDICTIAPEIGCAAVNLSCGYYNAHTTSEYVVLSEMENCIKKVCTLLERTGPEDVFEYIEAVYSGKYYGSLGGWKGYEFDYGYGYKSTDGEHYFCIVYTENGEEDYAEYFANSDFEALGMFFVDHQNLTYKDVVAIEDYGEDAYNL